MASLVKNNDYYRQIIVKHFNQPTHQGLLKNKNSYRFHYQSSGCVDDFEIELTIDKQKQVTAAKFDGIGCAISKAAIDIYCDLIIGKSLLQVAEINRNYEAMLQARVFNENLLGDLIAFQNVLKQPNRLRCALIISEAINTILLEIETKHNDTIKK